MTDSVIQDLRYPIGKLKIEGELTINNIKSLIHEIEQAPENLKLAVIGLSDKQLDTPYRPGGWTIRQVIHHLPDSHMNSYIRFKLSLTEDNPTVKPYDEAKWAELPDSFSTPISVSLRSTPTPRRSVKRSRATARAATTCDTEMTMTTLQPT